MKPVPLTPKTEAVARWVVWFEEPKQALADPVRFMAYAMTDATHEDMQILRQYVSDNDFREAIDCAPPGLIDSRLWVYWNVSIGCYPTRRRPPAPSADLSQDP